MKNILHLPFWLILKAWNKLLNSLQKKKTSDTVYKTFSIIASLLKYYNFKLVNFFMLDLFWNLIIQSKRKIAFSLVEMLMALLVASLLLAALAPVITRKTNEHMTVSGIGNYERADYGRAFYEDKEWAVPTGVNTIKVTAVGGGGAGGSTTYGYKKFTYTGSNQTFTVPKGVTKIRVYAIAGGGGGASGGDGANVAYGTLKSTGEKVFDNAGNNQIWNINADSKIPAVDSKCAASNVNTWILTSDNKTVMTPNNAYINVIACGGGGGGAHGGGGSGGYFNKILQINSSISSIYLTIGGGGGFGGADDTSVAGSASGYGGGGGGCEAIIENPSRACYGIGNGTGGNGGKIVTNCVSSVLSYLLNATDGNGTSGAGNGGISKGSDRYSCFATSGSGSLEGGGGGGGASHTGGGGGGGGATFFGRYGNSADSAFFNVAAGGGGGGGYLSNNTGGFGGGGGGGGKGGGNGGGYYTVCYGYGGSGGNNGTSDYGGASPIGGVNRCAGGNPRNNGQNGYMKISWSNSNKQLLKCNYISKTNAGGGGGTGQIWIGEINVIPEEILSISIGKGGNGALNKSSNGSNGTNTIISGSKTGSIINLSGGNGGTYSSTNSSGGLSAGYSTQKPWKNWTGLSVFDDSNKTALVAYGNGATGGKNSDNNYTGGRGGQTYSIENTVLEGGNGGVGNSSGSSPSAASYGTGGGGGGGNALTTSNTAGSGGNGANGYVYFEWGESSGGGGQSGQVVIKDNIWVSGGVSKVKINIGKGGTSSQETSLNWSGLLGKKGVKGGDTVVLVDNEPVVTAKGGYVGNAGILVHGTGGGKGNNEPETIKNTISGEDGTNEAGGTGASLEKSIFPLLDGVDKIFSTGGSGGSLSTSGEGKAGSGAGAGGGGGIFLNNRAYLGGKGSNGMVYIEWRN